MPVTLSKERLWHSCSFRLCKFFKNSFFYWTSPVATSVNRVKGLHFLCRKQSPACFFLLKMPQNYINQFATERKNCREKVFYITTFREIQKRPSTGVLIKGVLKKHSKFTGKHPCRFKVTLLKSHFGMGVPL